jgi:hypothetical protein
MATNEIKVAVDLDEVAKACAMIREAGRQLAESLKCVESANTEPWVIYSPLGRHHLVTYVDDRNQIRHCTEDLSVPESWRKLYVEKRA